MLTAVAERLKDQQGPLSQRLRNALVQSIKDGTLPSNRALPSERDLALSLGVSRSTLRSCLKELGDMGLVQTRHGAGTVVTAQIPKALSRLSGFTEDIRARGLTPTSDILECRTGPVSGESAIHTGMPLGTPVLTLVRLRRADGEAMSFETAIVPLWAVGEGYDGTGSLYDRMDAHNARPRRILQTLEAVAAIEEIADLLGIPYNAPVLRIGQVGYDASGKAVEDAVSWYRGDRYKYVGEIEG
ncbi:MAG: GntR family transcriptional regulator [Rhodobacterales bacterium]|nr:GntR family transcriptional regulator [Rhodobacterales bacterium]